MKLLGELAQGFRDEAMAAAGRVRNAVRLATGDLKAPEVGGTPHDVVMTLARSSLLRYRQDPAKRRYRVPILFVPSLVNRHYILDLVPKRSVVQWLLDAGFAVYMLDWGFPGIEDARTTLADYVTGRLDAAVRKVAADEHAPPTLIGYCMGGTLALLYAALFPKRVSNLVLLATPIDFEKGGLLHLWARRENFNVDRFVDAQGLVSPHLLNAAFTMLKPASQLRQAWDLFRFGWNDEFMEGYLAMAKWVNDGVPVAGPAYREYVEDYFRGNSLVHGNASLAGRPARIDAVTAAILNVVAEKDHIVPKDSSLALERLVRPAADYEAKLFPVGHIGLSVGSGAYSKVWAPVRDWLAQRSGEV